MKYWLIILVLFAFFAVACDDKPGAELAEADAAATKKVEKTPEPAKTKAETPKEEEKAPSAPKEKTK